MATYKVDDAPWTRRVQQVGSGLAMIKTGIDVGRAVYGVASAAAPYVLPAMAALAPVGL